MRGFRISSYLKIIYISVFLFIVLLNKGYSTEQLPDIIIINGTSFPIIETPLTSFLEGKNISFYSDSTANKKGYVAKWKITDGVLILHELSGEIKDSDTVTRPVGLNFIFEEKSQVFAKWFSGNITIPLSDPIAYDTSDSFEKIYERRIVFAIDEGKVLSSRLVLSKITEVSISIDELNLVLRERK